MIETAGSMNVPISLRVPAEDLEKHGRLRSANGLPYQTYMQMLLHEALANAE